MRNKKYIGEYIKTINSNFVFPPASYINNLLKFLDDKLKDPKLNVYQRAAYI
jgi:hypothetical protein